MSNDGPREAGTRVLPVTGARQPAPFTPRGWLGERSDGHRLHAGVDLGHAGADVVAPEAASVEVIADASYAERVPRFSRPSGWSGYGPTAVVLAGASGRWHLLAHLDRELAVGLGDVVLPGQLIGTVARIGSHVHWEVRERATPPRGVATVEVALDPLAWLDGRSEPWTPAVCPTHPTDDERTPRACRPGRTSSPRELPPEGDVRRHPIHAPRAGERDGAAEEPDSD